MSPAFQTAAALLIVAITITLLVRSALKKRKNPGCGGDCGCATDDFKAKLKH
jgi:hypothetical protein